MGRPALEYRRRRTTGDCGQIAAGRPPRWLLLAMTLLLFAVWGNSFVAIGHLLGADARAARFDWQTLAQARYLPVGLCCLAWCLLRGRTDTARVLRRRPLRAAIGGLCSVPIYGFALFYGQGSGVSAPVASLATALCPIFVIALASGFLGERMSSGQWLGVLVALSGVLVLAIGGTVSAPRPDYPLSLAAIFVAPLAWATFTIMSKPVVAQVGPVTWNATTLAAGGLLILPFGLNETWSHLRQLDAAGWAWLAYLILPCTLIGSAIWFWLLRYLDATTVGMTVFLNPPITTLSKLILSRISSDFSYSISLTDGVGGILALIGLAITVWPKSRVSMRLEVQRARPPRHE
ncbi:MAG: EamA family transporter [Thermoanaerobaculia bacterium]|nr:EamA family transporter [Thermoanaerobaculia bacterium]